MSVGAWSKMLLAVRAGVNGTKDSPIAAGAHVLFNIINCDGATLHNQTSGLLQAALDTRVPVFMGWDSQVWWDKRPELWNHWNATAPGYNSSNTENVEWTNWSASSALEISWLNWGRQMRMPPAQNIHAPKVKAATEAGLRAVAGAVASWWRASPSPEDRRLLAGIKIGCEAGIGWQTWVYPHANAIYREHPHNSSLDPTSGGNHSAPPDPPTFGHAQIGFAAAKSAGLKTSGNLTNHDVQTLTTWYLANMTNVVTAAGTHAHTHAHTHTHTHTHAHARTDTDTHTHTHAHTHTHTHSCTHALTHALTHSLTHSLIHSLHGTRGASIGFVHSLRPNPNPCWRDRNHRHRAHQGLQHTRARTHTHTHTHTCARALTHSLTHSLHGRRRASIDFVHSLRRDPNPCWRDRNHRHRAHHGLRRRGASGHCPGNFPVRHAARHCL